MIPKYIFQDNYSVKKSLQHISSGCFFICGIGKGDSQVLTYTNGHTQGYTKFPACYYNSSLFLCPKECISEYKWEEVSLTQTVLLVKMLIANVKPTMMAWSRKKTSGSPSVSRWLPDPFPFCMRIGSWVNSLALFSWKHDKNCSIDCVTKKHAYGQSNSRLINLIWPASAVNTW